MAADRRQAERREQAVNIGKGTAADQAERAAHALAKPLQAVAEIVGDAHIEGRCCDIEQGAIDIEKDRRLRQIERIKRIERCLVVSPDVALVIHAAAWVWGVLNAMEYGIRETGRGYGQKTDSSGSQGPRRLQKYRCRFANEFVSGVTTTHFVQPASEGCASESEGCASESTFSRGFGSTRFDWEYPGNEIRPACLA